MTSVSCATDSFCVTVDAAGEAVVYQQGSWGTPTTIDPAQHLVSVSCPSTDFCAAVDSAGGVVTFNGTSWAQPVAVDTSAAPAAISCAGPTSCEVVDGGGNVISLTGSVWTEVPNVDQYGFVTVTCPSATYCMASDGRRLLAFNGTTWTTLSDLGTTIESLSCSTGSFCAVGTSTGIFTQTDGIMTDDYPQAVGSSALPAIDCSSASFCVAVGAGQAYTYVGSALALPVTIDSHPLTGVSCASTVFCMAVDNSGQAVQYADPTWGPPQVIDGTVGLTGVSCAGTWCLAVDSTGDALTYQGNTWSAPVPVAGVSTFTGVSCVSASFCIATDSLGSVVTLNGSTWSAPVDLDGTTRLADVSCATSSFCVVVDSAANGHSFTFTGSTWSPPVATGDSVPLQTISCPSATYCLAADIYGSEAAFEGSAWSAPIFAGPTDPTAVSCTSSTSCVAAGHSIGLSFSDGSASTYPQYVGINYEVPSSISCVPSFCAVVDNQGKVATIVDAASTVTTSAIEGATPGAPVTYTAYVSGSDADQAIPTGTVTFTIGGVTQCAATLSGASATCTSPSAPAGTDAIEATYSGDSSHLASAAPPYTLSVLPSPGQPSVTGVGPASGCAVGGSQVTITGTNLTGTTTVDFGASASPNVTVSGPDSLVATVPPGSGVVDVSVTNGAGTSITTPADQFTYGPVVTGVSGSNPVGNALGGSTLYIRGIGFTGATAVDIGGEPAASFQVVHDWAVQAVTPPESGILDVTVTVGDCTSQINSADRYWQFSIVTSISPTTGVTGGGTAVTLTGAGFTGATAVDFGTYASPSFQVVSDSEVIAVSPPAPYKENVPVAVVTPMGGGESDASFLYDPYPSSGPPTITSFTPSTARAGTTVTITGTNLGDTTSLEFGSTSAWFQVDSGGELTTVVPDGASSAPITMTGTNGTATSAQSFILTDPSTVLPSSTCSQVVTDPTLSQVYVACGSSVSVFDDSGNLLATIGSLPEADSMVVIGSNLYVHMAGTGSIAQIDTATLSVTQVIAAGLNGSTSMVQADGKLWALSAGALHSVDPSTGATNSYANSYFPDLGSQGLRSNPANPQLLYDLDGFSTINVGVNPPTVSIPETVGSGLATAISGADDGLVTADGSHIVITGPQGAAEYDVHDPYGPVRQYADEPVSAIALSYSVDGGLVAAALSATGLQTVSLFGLTDTQLLASVSFGDDDATVPAQCLAISPDGTNLFAVTETNGTEAFHAVPLTLPATTPAFTSDAQAHVVVGEASTVTVSTSGSPSATLTESGALPAGLSFTPGTDGTANLTGTPSAASAGSYSVEVTATNSSGSATQDLTVIVDPVPTVTSPSTASFTYDDQVYFPISASGNPAPALTLSGPLPDGLTFTDHGDGTASIAGTPSIYSGGQYPVTITPNNGLGVSTQTLVMTVTGPASITSPATGEVGEGAPADVMVTSAGWPRPALSLSGTLPSGLHFIDHGDGTAVLTGTTTTTGSYPVRLTATNGIGTPATQNFTLRVGSAPAFTSENSASFAKSFANTFKVVATGLPAPTVSKTSGTLPTGVTFNAVTKVLSGTPTSTGTFHVTFSATNGIGSPATQSFTLTVVAMEITTTSLPMATHGQSYSVPLKGLGGKAPYKWTATGLPAGLTLATSTGVISGKPITAKNYTVKVTLTDSTTPTRNTATATFSLVVK